MVDTSSAAQVAPKSPECATRVRFQPSTGAATLSLPADAWFLTAATDGAAIDGSWGRTLTGAERSHLGASFACPEITLHDPSGVRP